MKKTHLLLWAFFALLTPFVQAQLPTVIPSGTTLTVPVNTAMPFPGGIIIESGGTLNIQSGAYVGIGVDKKIRVMDGGRILSLNGTISVILEASPGNWEGIEFDGISGVNVNSVALNMVGGAIRRAKFALNLEGPFRKVLLTAVTLQYNQRHILAQAAPSALLNGSRFTNCQFLDASMWWPILIGYMHDIQFDGCVFNYHPANVNSNGRMIHIDGPNLVVIKNCTFVYANNAISFHYFAQNSTISNCEFYFDEALTPPANSNVIEIGVETQGHNDNVLVEGNRIYSNGKGQVGNAIHVGNSYSSDVQITGNQIGLTNFGGQYGFGNGINIEKANDGFNLINENVIQKCRNGIYSGYDNPELTIVCNVLTGNGTHLYVSGLLGAQSPNGLDANNQFINAKGFDIYNAYATPLTYYTLNYVTMNAHPPMINFNVDINFVDLSVGCDTGGGHEDPHEGGGEGKEEGGRSQSNVQSVDNLVNISVFPNPASDVVNGMVQLEDDQSAAIAISSMTGQILLEQQISGSQQVSFDIASLPAGSYLFIVTNESGAKTIKRFTVIR